MIPMLDLKAEYEHMKHDIDTAIQKCLDHQRWIFGPEVKELEERMADYLGVKHCIGVSSGTEALVLSLRALAIKVKGEEYWDRDEYIITTPFTFTATGDAILRAGATPLFVDIDPNSYNLDPQEIGKALDYPEYKGKIIGILPVHLYGQACDMDEIAKIAGDHDLLVVEDVAQACGGMWSGRKLGSIGDAGAFSFFPSKNLGGFGDGGMVSTDDDSVDEIVRMLIRHGGKDKYNVSHIGYNARLDTLHAAVLLARLKYLDVFNEKRRAIAEAYNTYMDCGASDAISLPACDLRSHHVYHQYTLGINHRKRDELKKYLIDHAVSSMIYYPFPLHKMMVFDSHGKTVGAMRHAEYASETVLSLPMEPLMSIGSVRNVCQSVQGFLGNLE